MSSRKMKPRLIKDYEKLSEAIKKQIKLTHPYGFDKELITFKNKDNKTVSALPYETDEFSYLLKMSQSKAREIIRNDDDYDDDGILKDEFIEELNEKNDIVPTADEAMEEDMIIDHGPTDTSFKNL